MGRWRRREEMEEEGEKMTTSKHNELNLVSSTTTDKDQGGRKR